MSHYKYGFHLKRRGLLLSLVVAFGCFVLPYLLNGSLKHLYVASVIWIIASAYYYYVDYINRPLFRDLFVDNQGIKVGTEEAVIFWHEVKRLEYFGNKIDLSIEVDPDYTRALYASGVRLYHLGGVIVIYRGLIGFGELEEEIKKRIPK